MNAEIQNLLARFDRSLAAANTLAEIEAVRVEFVGRKSLLRHSLRDIGRYDPEIRRVRAAELNAAVAQVEAQLDEKLTSVRARELDASLAREWADPTLPGIGAAHASIHPVTVIERRSIEVFRQLGFVVADGPEVESAYFNFDALNMPEHHPARDVQDTFWLEGGLLLRSHTTTIQARTLAEKTPLPIKVVAAGRVYRNEAVDATHLAMFHQLEGFWVEEGITFPHLKGVLAFVARALYGPHRRLRFKPKFYPYTEPSIGLDIACATCDGAGCGACHGAGWVTLMGAGMIHPNVLRQFGYLAPGIRGLAFGWGTARMTAQWLGLDAIRTVYSTDYRLLRQLHRGSE